MTTTVTHVMRTYGVHGGEQQLSQLFSTFADPGFRHRFFFVYRDDVCSRRFARIEGLATSTLLPLRSRTFPSLLAELSFLLAFLPILQLRTLWLLMRTRSRLCVAHGVQAALVCWLPALVLRRTGFAYVHRGTKSTMGRSRWFRLLYSPYRIVAGVSEASVASLAGLADSSKLCVVQNGIDIRAVDAQRSGCPVGSVSSTFVVCCVGRLLPQKGQKLIVEAFALLCRGWPDSELVVVGDGPDLGALIEQAKAEGVLPKVRFLGLRSDVVCILRESKVFVHASESEGLSNSVLEAMAMQLPSVVVAAPGVSECHVDTKTGYVVARSATSISERLLALARDPHLRASMGAAARRRVEENFSMEANCSRYAAVYRQLLQKNGKE